MMITKNNALAILIPFYEVLNFYILNEERLINIESIRKGIYIFLLVLFFVGIIFGRKNANKSRVIFTALIILSCFFYILENFIGEKFYVDRRSFQSDMVYLAELKKKRIVFCVLVIFSIFMGLVLNSTPVISELVFSCFIILKLFRTRVLYQISNYINDLISFQHSNEIIVLLPAGLISLVVLTILQYFLYEFYRCFYGSIILTILIRAKCTKAISENNIQNLYGLETLPVVIFGSFFMLSLIQYFSVFQRIIFSSKRKDSISKQYDGF